MRRIEIEMWIPGLASGKRFYSGKTVNERQFEKIKEANFRGFYSWNDGWTIEMKIKELSNGERARKESGYSTQRDIMLREIYK